MSVQQVLKVRTQDKFYAIDLNYVTCVLPLMELQYIPGGAPFLVGLMDYHGKSIAVIDLGLWLGSNTAENYHLDTPIIVCNYGQAQIAFIVDEVMQVEMVKPGTIHMQDSFEDSHSPFKASLNSSSGMMLILDIEQILGFNFNATNAFITETSQSQ